MKLVNFIEMGDYGKIGKSNAWEFDKEKLAKLTIMQKSAVASPSATITFVDLISPIAKSFHNSPNLLNAVKRGY